MWVGVIKVGRTFWLFAESDSTPSRGVDEFGKSRETSCRGSRTIAGAFGSRRRLDETGKEWIRCDRTAASAVALAAPPGTCSALPQ